MTDNTNLKLTMEAWADIVIKEWRMKVSALNISVTYQLVRSFEAHVITAANGDPEKVLFAFEWYGKMLDYGVGKYVTLADRDGMIAAKTTNRIKKPWFSDTFYKQLASLRHILAEKYAQKTEMLIVRNIDDNADYQYNKQKI